MQLVYLMNGTVQLWYESAIAANKAYPRKDVLAVKNLYCECIKSIDELVKLYPLSEDRN
jgi:hypothetical protein